MTPPVMGSVTPRIYTGNPTGRSHAADFLAFARVCGETPDPWHRWLAEHALQTLPDGSLRFRTYLLLVARQNGKSWFLRMLVLWFMFTGRARFVLWTSQSLSVSGNMHRELVETINRVPHLAKRVKSVTQRYEEKTILLHDGSLFRIVANTPDASRSLSVDLLVVDELRTFKHYDGWNALEATTAARPHAFIVCASNAGDDESVVLNDFLDAAREHVADPDTAFGLAEWSAPDGASLTDPVAIAQANPALGHGRSTMRAIVSARDKMKEAGFRTEYLCQRVRALDPALPGWDGCSDMALSIAGLPRAVGFDVSLDGRHATLVAAARLPDGRIGVRVVDTWASVTEAVTAIQGLQLGERFAWAQNGPAAGVGPTLARMKGSVAMGAGDVTAAAMALAPLVAGRRLVHPNDPLLNDQVGGALRQWSGDRWNVSRKGGHCDAVYALALAVRALETEPPSAPAWTGSLVV